MSSFNLQQLPNVCTNYLGSRQIHTTKPVDGSSYHGNFSSGNHGVEKELPPAGFLLVQHVLELFLGIAFEPHKFESESLPFLPPDDRQGNDN
jgi:hypothetical protein